MINILEKITYYRNLRGWTEYQLAERAEIPQSTINSWYRKNLIPALPSIDKICKAFDITLSQFFSNCDDTPELTETQKELLSASCRLDDAQIKKLIAFINML